MIFLACWLYNLIIKQERGIIYETKNILKGYRVIIKDHALKRYLVRCEILTEAEYYMTKQLADNGDKSSKDFLDEQRKKLERKFRNSFLSHFQPDGSELRKEISGSKNSRCTFVAIKEGNSFVVKTAFLQGKKRDLWKIENSRRVI